MVSAVLAAVLVAERSLWSVENLTMEGSSWNNSGFRYTSVALMKASNSCLLSLLVVTGKESGLGEGCVRGSFEEGRLVPTSN